MKSLIYIASFLMLMASCKNKDSYTVKGRVDNPGDLKQVLLYRNNELLDSAYLNEDNEFRFTRIAPEADFYNLVLNDMGAVFVAKNGDELEFEFDLSKPGVYEVNGNEDTEKLKAFNDLSSKYTQVFAAIQNEFTSKVSENPALRDSLNAVLSPRFENNLSAYSKATLEFGKENVENLAGFYAMGTLDQVKYEQELLGYAEKIKGKFSKIPSIEQFLQRMEVVAPVSIGKTAPAFEMPNQDGKVVRLSDFRGKYVLVDFWASWCGPCRNENPNIVRLYQQFKAKNFTILGVSLDDDRADWLKAVKDDKLTWTQVSELKRWESPIVNLYKIESIPASFLLDPNGKIIAKNLRGAELEAFLTKTLGK